MEFLGQDPNKAWKFKRAVNSKVSLIELMKKYNMELEEKNTGESFTHRTYCPFHKGKNGGRERTPSMFVSQKTNTFFCFGCCISGGPIDFVSLIEGTPPVIAIQKLAKGIGLLKKNGQWDELQIDALEDPEYAFDPSKTIEPYIFDMSTVIREFIQKYGDNEKEFKWIEGIGKQLDRFIDKIGYEDWEDAIKIKNKLLKKLRNRELKLVKDETNNSR